MHGASSLTVSRMPKHPSAPFQCRHRDDWIEKRACESTTTRAGRSWGWSVPVACFGGDQQAPLGRERRHPPDRYEQRISQSTQCPRAGPAPPWFSTARGADRAPWRSRSRRPRERRAGVPSGDTRTNCRRGRAPDIANVIAGPGDGARYPVRQRPRPLRPRAARRAAPRGTVSNQLTAARRASTGLEGTGRRTRGGNPNPRPEDRG
jgi:hypothetical protein